MELEEETWVQERGRVLQLLQDFVDTRGGTRVIRKVLIANNGLAATKAMRSLRLWSYEVLGLHDALHLVAMVTPEDKKANVEYLRLANEYVIVPGGPNRNNYADVDLVVNTARRLCVDAVWTGWGHASENPRLPSLLAAENIAFLGPPASAMNAVGDKIAANILAQSVGVNVIPWSGTGLTVPGTDIPPDVFARATVHSEAEAVSMAERIGFPLMVKASEGGGGKGIRMVRHLDHLAVAYNQVCNEVVGSPVFLQKLSQNSRHLEVQVIADVHGNAISLYGRDCSVQRRHQKIIEEGPVAVAPRSTVEELEQGAVRLAKKVGYRGAGTVEYLYNETETTFLEVNPRLQVEHPVTESITGVNIPSIQLMIAMGIPLHAMPDIRRFYGEDPNGTAPIDFDNRRPNPPRGHCVAVRITAEDVTSGFRPTSGSLRELTFRSVPGVMSHFSVRAPGSVHQFADSQFGHIFALAPTRKEAISKIAMALMDMEIRGEISTTIKYLLWLISLKDFEDDLHDTSWLDRLIASRQGPEHLSNYVKVLSGMVVAARLRYEERLKNAAQKLNRGVTPEHKEFSMVEHDLKLILHSFGMEQDWKVRFNSIVTIGGGDHFYIRDREWSQDVAIHVECMEMDDGGLLMQIDKRLYSVYVDDTFKGGLKLDVNGSTVIFPNDADPTKLTSPATGKLIQYLVPNGGKVEPGTSYAEIESMKMILPLVSQLGGKIIHAKAPGANLETGDLLARLELEDGAITRDRVHDYDGGFPVSIPRQEEFSLLDTVASFHKLIEAVNNILDGFGSLGNPIKRVFELTQSPALPYGELVTMRGKLVQQGIDDNVLKELDATIELLGESAKLAHANAEARKKAGESGEKPALVHTMSNLEDKVIMAVAQLKNNLEEFSPRGGETNGKSGLEELAPEIMHFIRRYENGLDTYEVILCEAFIRRYISVEERFALAENKTFEEIIQALNDTMDDKDAVLLIGRSHNALKFKNQLLMMVLERAKEKEMVKVAAFQETLSRLANFEGQAYSTVAQTAKVILMERYEMERTRSRKWAKLRLQLGKGDMDGEGSLPGSPSVRTGRQSLRLDGSSSQDDAMAIGQSPRRSPHAMRGSRNGRADSVGLRIAVHGLNRDHAHSASPSSASGYGSSDEDFDNSRSGDDAEANGNGRGFDYLHRRHSDNSSDMAVAAALASAMSGEGDDSGALESDIVEDEPSYFWWDLFHSTDDVLRQQTMREYYNAYGAKDVAIMCAEGTIRVNFGNAASIFVARDVDEIRRILARIRSGEGQAAADRNLQAVGFFVEGNRRDGDEKSHQSDIEKIAQELDAEKAFPPSVKNVAMTVVRSDGGTPEHYLLARRPAVSAESGEAKSEESFQNIHVSSKVDTVLAFHLELERLSTFDVTCKALHEPRKKLGLCTTDPSPRQLMGFVCKADYRIGVFLGEEKSYKSYSTRDRRIFVRSVVYKRDVLLGGFVDSRRLGSAQRLRSLSGYFGRSTRNDDASKLGNANGDGPPTINVVESSPGRSLSDRRLMDEHNLSEQVLASDSVLVDILDKLELAVGEEHTAWNFVYINLAHECANEDLRLAEDVMHAFVAQCGSDLRRLKVAFIEMKVPAGRIVAYNPTGYKFNIECQMRTTPKKPPLPYALVDRIQRKRMIAQNVGSTYVYDFIDVFEHCAVKRWEEYGYPLSPAGPGGRRDSVDSAQRSRSGLQATKSGGGAGGGSAADGSPGAIGGGADRVFVAEELVLDRDSAQLRAVQRDPGNNTVGMVVWRCRMKTPEYPDGRWFYVVASDITHQSGSFSPAEDDVYVAAYDAALAEGLPVVYISSNSGARIGLDEQCKRLFKVKWNDETDETKGFEYLYLESSDYERLRSEASSSGGAYRPPVAEKVMLPDGGVHYRLYDVPGGIGVECLCGSGRIASSTSKANKEVVTIAYVTGRAVGIGAYISRLASRIIQHKNAPLILTGSSALNKVLGRNVYTSNDQIGGPRVMARNGVSQKVVDDDVKGIEAVLNWLSYVPETTRAVLPGLALTRDSPERMLSESSYKPTNDPRIWLREFFDAGSFDECMELWGKTVITARARLSGLPCGVVGVETRVTEKFTPADPALDQSVQSKEPQPGQVWFPDSAYKTAQAITDMNREGLPLFIFANWRGFAGGLRDMFSEILKYGSYIVDALRVYKQPIFTYIPNDGELRGGAWVVIDTTINPDFMEMYAAGNAKGGVLEPEGIVDIKFRRKDLEALMDRASTAPMPGIKEGARPSKERASAMPSYKQVATHFASLHDTPTVMQMKGAIRGVVPWPTARCFFIRRLRRRMAVERIKHLARTTDPTIDEAGIEATLQELGDCLDTNERATSGPLHVDDRQDVQRTMKLVRRGYISRQASVLLAEDRAEVEAAMARCAGEDIGASLLALGNR